MTFFDLTTDPSGVVPDFCTLPTAEQPLRMHEFDELFRTAVTDVERTSAWALRLVLTAEPEVAATAAALAAREANCCSFFTFTLTVAALELHLDIEVPTEQTDVLDALARRAAAART